MRRDAPAWSRLGHVKVHVYRGLDGGKFRHSRPAAFSNFRTFWDIWDLENSEDVPVFESPPLHTVRPSAPPDSGITLNPQPAADIGHAATPYGYSGGLTKFKLNCK